MVEVRPIAFFPSIYPRTVDAVPGHVGIAGISLPVLPNLQIPAEQDDTGNSILLRSANRGSEMSV